VRTSHSLWDPRLQFRCSSSLIGHPRCSSYRRCRSHDGGFWFNFV
jgi:hypothetical protein